MNFSQLRFLVVDDCEITRALHAGVLTALGHLTEEAEDGSDALKELFRKKFDGLVTDNQMPRLRGVELVKRVRRFRFFDHISIYIVSSDDPAKIRTDLGDALGVEVLQKPMSKKRFEDVVDGTYRFRRERETSEFVSRPKLNGHF
jgi:CheY-like chemotaxis protein